MTEIVYLHLLKDALKVLDQNGPLPLRNGLDKYLHKIVLRKLEREGYVQDCGMVVVRESSVTRGYSLTDKGRELMDSLENEVESVTVETTMNINFGTLTGEMDGKKMSEDDVAHFIEDMDKGITLAFKIANDEGRKFPTIEDFEKARRYMN